jgi:hypothetical protein
MNFSISIINIWHISFFLIDFFYKNSARGRCRCLSPLPPPMTLDAGTVYGYESHEKQAIFITILWANGNSTHYSIM